MTVTRILVGTTLMLVSVIAFASPQAETVQPASEPASAPGSTGEIDHFPSRVSVEYSDVFDVEYHGSYKTVTITEPWPGAEAGFTYVLYQRGTPRPEVSGVDQFIEIPITSIVSMSTSYLPHLEMLDVADTLLAVDATAWISSPAFVAMADELAEVGSGPTVNLEILLDLDPDLIMTYGQGNEWDTFPKLEEANLPYVINAEWTESTPLARAEWVKFVSLFYNREAEANRQFDAIVSAYESLAARAAAVSEKPTVFLGAPFQGTWWVAGGGSFAAKLIEDAGAEYVWADNDSTGSLMLDIESVFEKAGKSDYWLNTGSWNSLDDARKADERFTEFAAFENEQVYNNNRRMGPGGGNEYFETGPAYPHRVLADLIHIFHPQILPDHELYYYQKLD